VLKIGSIKFTAHYNFSSAFFFEVLKLLNTEKAHDIFAFKKFDLYTVTK